MMNGKGIRVGILVSVVVLTMALVVPASQGVGIVQTSPDVVPVCVSSDGSLALFTSATCDGLIVKNLNTDEQVDVTSGHNAGYYATLSPDNRYVCFKAFHLSEGKLLQQAVLFDIAAKSEIALCSPSPVAGTPTVAANGTIAFTVGNELVILTPALEVVDTFDLGHHVNLVALSPDGTRAAFNNKDEQIVVLDLQSGTRDIVTDGSEGYWGPEFSPSGAGLLIRGVSGKVAVSNLASGAFAVLGKGDAPGWVDDQTVSFIERIVDDFEVTEVDLVVAPANGAAATRSILNAGDAHTAMNRGHIVSAQAGSIKCGNLQQGAAAWKKDISIPDGQGGDVATLGDVGIESVIQTGNIVEITGVPVINQVYDTLDDFCGSWACNATAALMAIQYYNILPADPRTVSYPYTHTSDYGFYISEIYTFNGHTYNVKSKDCAQAWAYGGYGYIVQNNWEDTKTHMAEYISYHGPDSAVDWSPTFGKACNEVYSGCPSVLLNSLTTAGHYITTIGYFTDQYTLVFNDPYGNKNTPGYPSFDGERVFYDWPGYNYGNQNLNTVWCYIWCRINPGPTPTPSPTPEPTPTPVPGTDMIVDNDYMAPAYVETGTWTTSSSTGYNGSTYRYASALTAATATWTASLSETGNYDVYVYYRAGTNRTTSTRYDIAASDGTHTVTIDQTVNDMTWVHLGSFPFNAGDNSLTLDALNSTPSGAVVIADAVRFTLNASPTPTPTVTPTVTATPSPTPSPTPVAVDMYVNDITMTSGSAGKNYFADATIWIKDVTTADVSGATVSATWSGSVSGTASGVTGADGKVTLRSLNVKSGGTFTITVTNVTAAGYTYNSALNNETSDSITAP